MPSLCSLVLIVQPRALSIQRKHSLIEVDYNSITIIFEAYSRAIFLELKNILMLCLTPKWPRKEA